MLDSTCGERLIGSYWSLKTVYHLLISEWGEVW